MSQMRKETMSLILQSPVIPPGQKIPRRHTGDGEDLSPPLSWSGLPAQTRELALIVDDPDAPSSQPWVHWVLYKIPVAEQGIAEGVHAKASPSFPPGSIQGKNSWGSVGFRGPAPPKGHGTHRYFFKLYALDAPLALSPGMDKDGLIKAMQGHVLAEGELVGTYERK
jgi:Raf kinase inhibitor-like YbhB/YbcL family protein